MINIVAILQGRNTASSWFRIGQLDRYLLDNEIKLTNLHPKIAATPPIQKFARPFWLTAALIERMTYLWRVDGYDATILQRELISTLPTLEKWIPGPKILDVDDAIYFHRHGWAAKNAAKASIGVVCGNEELANRFSQWNSNISIIPTGVDVDCMKPNADRLKNSTKVIGWIGTAGNLQYMDSIADSIIKVLSEVNNAELRIVTSHASAIPHKLKPYARFIPWYRGIEFDEIPQWSLGIMPLIDNEWTRGKCSFKLLQYLSAGIPVVASPVGMNKTVLESSDVGYSAIKPSEWSDAIIDLLINYNKNFKVGLNGRKLVEAEYSLDVVAKKWKHVLLDWV